MLVAKTLDEMGLQGKVTLAAVNWAMDPTVGLLGEENIRADGLPAMSGMIGSLPLRSWAETDHPGIQLITEQADLHQRPAAGTQPLLHFGLGQYRPIYRSLHPDRQPRRLRPYHRRGHQGNTGKHRLLADGRSRKH